MTTRFVQYTLLNASYVLILFTASALAFEGTDARSGGLGMCVPLFDMSAADIWRAPAGTITDGTLLIEAGASRRYELKELDLVSLVVAFKHRAGICTLGYQQFGQSDLYAEKTARGSAGISSEHLSAAIFGSGRIYSFGSSYEEIRSPAVGLALGYRQTRLALHVAIDDLNRPQPFSGSPRESEKISLYSEAQGEGRFSVLARGRWERHKRPSFGFGQIIFATPAARFTWGLSMRPLLYGAGFEYHARNYGIVYCGWYHPVLGYSQSASLMYHFSFHKKSL